MKKRAPGGHGAARGAVWTSAHRRHRVRNARWTSANRQRAASTVCWTLILYARSSMTARRSGRRPTKKKRAGGGLLKVRHWASTNDQCSEQMTLNGCTHEKGSRRDVLQSLLSTVFSCRPTHDIFEKLPPHGCTTLYADFEEIRFFLLRKLECSECASPSCYGMCSCWLRGISIFQNINYQYRITLPQNPQKLLSPSPSDPTPSRNAQEVQMRVYLFTYRRVFRSAASIGSPLPGRFCDLRFIL